jgi:uncharacterized protein (DUF1800 family)
MNKTLALAAAICCAVILPDQLSKAEQNHSQFEKRLSSDLAILHALNRLTFGPRAGDIEAVKNVGLSRWIDLQLHPERIPENEALTRLVAPLVEPSALAQGAGVRGQQAQLQQLLTPPQIRLLRTGTAKEAADFLATLPPEQAAQVLALMPAVRQKVGAAAANGAVKPAAQAQLQQLLTPQQIHLLRTGTAKEAADLLATLPREQAAQVLALMPAVRQKVGAAAANGDVKPAAQAQLQQLLTPAQIQLLRTGSDKEGLDLLASLPPEKVVQVLAIMPAVRQRLLPQLDADMRVMVEAAGPAKLLKQPGQTLAQAKLYRAIESDRQLLEVLVDFWYNHFNVDAGKGADRYLVTAYERDAIRSHVLGKFRDLLEATANSPAMMFYLDNWQSTVARPGAVNAKQAARGVNENYARELMELHTLGVDGGYTQKDIVEVARCFTGWTIDQPRQGGPFRYNDRMHDKGAKTVLGVTIPAGGGKGDGEKVLDILAHHPATAKFISREIAQRFVADEPPLALVDRMAKTFHDSDGDIRAVLNTLFTSQEFFSEGAYRAKVKTPFEMIVSSVRAVGATVDNAGLLVSQAAALGQPLYRKQEPTGYSNVGEDWMNSAALLARMNFALQLAQNQMEGVKLDAGKFSPVPAAAARQILFADAAQQTLDAIGKELGEEQARAASRPPLAGARGLETPMLSRDREGAVESPGLVAGMLLGSPDFQRR